MGFDGNSHVHQSRRITARRTSQAVYFSTRVASFSLRVDIVAGVRGAGRWRGEVEVCTDRERPFNRTNPKANVKAVNYKMEYDE